MTSLRLGILFSTSGDYGVLGRDCRDGAMIAIEELHGACSIAIEPVFGDPGGSSERYIELARKMLLEDGCRHVIGTVTSQARKDVIPVIEKHDALLWYVCPYEGFEANPNVIYTGACPNQHLLPLFEHMLPVYGRRVYLTGANYIWGWEMNRLAREIVKEAGGEIVGERCLPIGDTDVDRIIAEVATRRPNFILSNMLGPSNHTFLRAMCELGRRDPAFRPERCPVVSCDLTECELPEIGIGVADGQLAAASYFDSLDTPANRALKAQAAARFGSDRRVSSYFATSYATVRLCLEAVTRCGTDDPVKVRAALANLEAPSPLGPLLVDPATNHTNLPFLLGRILGADFVVLQSRPAAVADPYLIRKRTIAQPRSAQPQLRVVS
jgi:ABC-type branched-subunit amino acid transport system substrate-binding protein